MELNAYQKFARTTAIYPEEAGVVYTMLGSCGEAGELAEKLLPMLHEADRGKLTTAEQQRYEFLLQRLHDFVAVAKELEAIKKAVRKREVNLPTFRELTIEERIAAGKEVGDQLWYIAENCGRLGFTFDEVATQNINKLTKRKDEGKLHGVGDNR